MNKLPLISVILSCRSKDTICRGTLESIKAQTYSNVELVISAGTDNNQLVRNRGFKNSKGRYLFFCDEDIILNKDCLEKLYRAMSLGNYAFAYCNYQRSEPFGDIQYGRPFDPESLSKINYISTMSLMKRYRFPQFDPELKRLQDWSLYLTIVENGGVGIWVDEVLFLAMYKKGDISCGGADNWHESVRIVKEKHNLA